MACSLGAMRKRRCGPGDLRIEPMTDADLFAEHRSTPLGWANAFKDQEAIEYMQRHQVSS